VIAACLLGVAALAAQIPKLEIDTSVEGFIEEDDPARIAYNEFREQFGREDAAVLAIRTDEVFRFEFLERLRALHEELEDELPHLDEVTSLVNVRYTRGRGDELLVDDFLEDWPETQDDLRVLRERALAHPLYRDSLISEDATLATVMIQTSAYSSLGEQEDALAGFDDASGAPADANGPVMLTGAENSELVATLMEIVARHSAPGFEIHVAGQPVLTDLVMRGMIEDMARFTALSIAIIAVFLAYLFHSIAAVVLALSTALLAVICGFGAMAVTGTPLSAPTQVTPSFLLAVGVGNSVHLIAIFLQRRERGDPVVDALAYALGHSGLAIVMTGLTTAGSLLSFLSAKLALVADFGIVAPVGVMLALVLSLVLLPALMAIVPMRAKPSSVSGLRRFPVACGALGTRHPFAVTTSWLAVFAASLAGALQVRFSNHSLEWFQPDEPFRIAAELVDAELGGANSIELVVDSRRENGLYEPALLRRIDAMQQRAEGQPAGTGKVGRTSISIVEVIKEIHQALNANDPDSYAIPDDRQLVAQELLLFENSGTDDLEDVVDSQFRIGLLVPLLHQLERDFNEVLGDAADFEITGAFKIGSTTATATIESLSRTYLLAFAVITPLMMILLGSLRTGLLSMVPAMGAILVTLGVMSLFDLPLDGFTLLVGSIALGLAVDDTIHFMHNYARARARGDDVHSAVRTTLASTGQALFFTSLVLTAGFLVYTQAKLNMLFNFGLLTALAISLAFAANVTLAPALVTLVARVRGDVGGSRS
jgi:predicted RND superfamily exporter protein